MSWYNETAAGDQTGYVVVEAKLGASRANKPLPTWKRQVLQRLSAMVSNALRQTMQMIERSLSVTMENEKFETKTVEGAWQPEGAWFVKTAALKFRVNPEQAQRIRALLAQEEKPYGYTNAYRFVGLDQDADGFVALAEIAKGEWVEKKGKRHHALSVIQSTTGLQQLIATYLQPAFLMALPRALRAGVAQEAAQQTTSYLGQLDSTKVKGETAFPTVEDRDPERRKTAYDAALEELIADVRPFNHCRARDKDPGKYQADDPRGDRLIVDDERWFAVTTSPDPHPIPLFFVQGDSVRVELTELGFAVGVSKKNRHRGRLEPSERVLADRPEKVRAKGETRARLFSALLSVLDTDDEEIARILQERDQRKQENPNSRGRNMAGEKQPLPLVGPAKNRETDLRLPMSFDRGRFERLLSRSDLQVAWARLVHKRGDWFLQLTLRVPYSKPIGLRRVLGVSFGLDAIISWTLLDDEGKEMEAGALAPNPQIKAFLERKLNLEWDQQKGRWVGGKSFDRELESIAHRVANQAVELARAHGARLCVHDIQWVQKSSPDSKLNVLFTAWNYGQMRRYLEYKAPLAGLGIPLFTGDYIVRMTCPKCGAVRGAKEKPEMAATWRTNGVLHCRKCGFAGELTGAQNARRVVEHGLSIARKFWAKEQAK